MMVVTRLWCCLWWCGCSSSFVSSSLCVSSGCYCCRGCCGCCGCGCCSCTPGHSQPQSRWREFLYELLGKGMLHDILERSIQTMSSHTKSCSCNFVWQVFVRISAPVCHSSYGPHQDEISCFKYGWSVLIIFFCWHPGKSQGLHFKIFLQTGLLILRHLAD